MKTEIITKVRSVNSYLRYYLCVGIVELLKFSNILSKEWIAKKVTKLAGERLFHFLFQYLGYHGPLLSDLERYLLAGKIRADWIRARGEYVNQRPWVPKKDFEPIKIGLIGVFGEESNFPRDFFIKSPRKFEIYLYDQVRPNIRDRKYPYKGTKLFNNVLNLEYRLIECDYYLETPNKIKNFAEKIENDSPDILISVVHTFALLLLDYITVPRIYHMNLSSLPVPHPKSNLQSFDQPPWPYSVQEKNIFNLRTGKILSSPEVCQNGIIFSKRIATKFKAVPWPERKNQIFFSGNLEKLYVGTFAETLYKILNENQKTQLIYFGAGFSLEKLEQKFIKLGIKDRTHFRGRYEQRINDQGDWIFDEHVLLAFDELRYSKLFLNTFPLSAARSCIEAYTLEVPVVHLDLTEKEWLCNQHLQYLKLPILLTQSGTANSIEEYFEKAKKVLNDERFGENLIEEQLYKLEKLVSHQRLWNIITDKLID